MTLTAWLLLVVVVVLAGRLWWPAVQDGRTERFYTAADNLMQALEQYKEFDGDYPRGSNMQISHTLSGKGEKRITILAVRNNELSDRGEIIDPWGTPLQFYFSHDAILIRSAGPNKIFEDRNAPGCDDLFRTN